jgi:transposase-like protein
MESESKTQAVIEALQSGAFPIVRQAAHAFNIPTSTLHARIHGRLPHKLAHEAQRRFSNAEEASIVKAVYQMDSWGWAMTVFALDNFANDLLQAKGDPKPSNSFVSINRLA